MFAIAMILYIYSGVQFVKMCAFLFTDSVAIRVYDKPYRDSDPRMARLKRSYKAFGKMLLAVLLATGAMMLTM